MSSSQRILAVRLSALGDVMLAQSAVYALRRHLPSAEITWMIDERLVGIAQQVPGVTALGIRKPGSPSDYLRLWRSLRAMRFDTVLAMQASLRVNLIYAGLPCATKIGFDRRRARDGHRWFVNRTIAPTDEHLLDGFQQFARALGAPKEVEPSWPDWDSSAAETRWRERRLPSSYVVIHTGTSKPERCWPVYRHGELAAHFASRPELGVVLTGGNSGPERAAALAFQTECPRAVNLCGKTQLDDLRVLLRHASAVISPDTAAVHLARVEGTPVVGLYAVARPQLSGPYRKLDYTVDAYPEAVRRFAGKDAGSVDWHFRVHHPDAMALIEAPAVWHKLEAALGARS